MVHPPVFEVRHCDFNRKNTHHENTKRTKARRLRKDKERLRLVVPFHVFFAFVLS